MAGVAAAPVYSLLGKSHLPKRFPTDRNVLRGATSPSVNIRAVIRTPRTGQPF